MKQTPLGRFGSYFVYFIAVILGSQSALWPMVSYAASPGQVQSVVSTKLPSNLVSATQIPPKTTAQVILPGSGDLPAVPSLKIDKPVEQVAERTATSTVFREPDGSYKRTEYLTPHFYKVAGMWQPIDTNVVSENLPVLPGSSPIVSYITKSDDWAAHVATSTAASGIVRVDDGSTHIAIRPLNANTVNPALLTDSKGTQYIHYANLWPGVDVDYQLTSTQVKESIIVKNASIAPNFQFAVDGAELTPHATIHGAFSLKGNSSLYISPVSISATPTLSSPPKNAVSQSLLGSTLTVSLNQTWLSSLPKTAFPFIIDPTVQRVIIDNDYVTYKSDGFVCDSATCYMNVGVLQQDDSDWYAWRTVFNARYISFLQGVQFLGANLHLEMAAARDNFWPGVTDGRPIGVSHATCFGFDCIDYSKTQTSLYVETSGNINVTGVYQSIIDSGDWYGCLILTGEESNPTNWSLKKFDPNISYVDFTYNSPPPVTTQAAPANGGIVTTLQPTLVANGVHDPNSDLVHYNFQICTSSDCSNIILASGDLADPKWTSPLGSLQDGTTYYWRVATRDDNNGWQQSPAVWSFKTDLRNGKDSTQSYDSSGAVSVDTSTGNVTTSASTHSIAALGGSLSVGLAYNTPTRSTQGLMAQYWNNPHLSDAPILQRVENTINYEWETGSPQLGLIPNDNFSARWKGYFVPPTSGTYYFGGRNDDAVTVTVNGQVVFQNAGSGNVSYGSGIYLTGSQPVPINVDYVENGGLAYITLMVTGAVPEQIIPASMFRTDPLPVYQSQGVNATYYTNDGSNTFDSSKIFLQRKEQLINNIWQDGGPLYNVTENFLARYTGYFTAPTTGDFTFGAGSDDGSRLYLNGSINIDHWVDQPYLLTYGNAIHLNAGQTIPLVYEFYEHNGWARADLWVKGAVPEQVVPTQWLSPDANLLPNGWQLSVDGDGNLAYQSAQVNSNSIVLSDPTGSTHEYKWDGTKNAYTPPVNENGTLVRASTGQITLNDTDGRTYVFDARGILQQVTSTVDYKNPSAIQFIYGGSPSRLTKVVDGVDSSRFGQLYYGTDSTCGSAPSGFDTSVPDTYICGYKTSDGQMTNLYYRSGQLGRVQLPGNEITDYAYDSTGRLIRLRSSVTYDAILANVFPDDGTGNTDISYDSLGRAIKLTLPAATPGANRAQHAYRYSANATETTEIGETEPNGYSSRTEYDELYRTVKSYDKAGLATLTAWDPLKDLVLATTDPTGFMSTKFYNVSDRITDAYGPAPSSWFNSDRTPLSANVASTPHTTTRYDENMKGFGVSYYDYVGAGKSLRGSPKFYATGISADGLGNPLRLYGQTNPINVSSDAQGWGVRATGRITLPSAGTYNIRPRTDNGYRLWIDDKLAIDDWTDGGLRDHVSYNLVNDTDGKSYKVRVEYYHLLGGDATFSMVLNGPGYSENNTWGSIISPDYGLSTSTTVYNSAQGNTTTSTDFGANPEFGLAQSTTEDVGGLNLKTSYTYESPGNNTFFRQTNKTLPGGTTTQYLYYAANATADNPCTPTVESFHEAGLQKGKITQDPDGSGPQTGISTESIYDDAGRPVATRTNTDPWTCTSYDSRGRTVQTITPGLNGNPSRTITNVWAVNGNPFVTSTSDSSGTILVTTDLLGRTVKYQDASGSVTSTTYDDAGHLTQEVSPLGNQQFGYDSLDRLSNQSLDGKTLATETYDSFGRVNNVSYNQAGNLQLSTVNRDTLNRVSGFTYTSGGSTVSNQVVRAVTGDIQSETNNGIAASYTYDKAGRLTNAAIGSTAFAYGYNNIISDACKSLPGINSNAYLNSNRSSATVNGTTVNYCYNLADQLIYSNIGNSMSPGYNYDSHGNMISTGNNNVSNTSFTFDSSDRNTGISQWIRSVNYKRDVQGRISQRITTGPKLIGGDSTQDPNQTMVYGYTGAGDTPDFVKNTSGAVVAKYISLPGNVLLTINPLATTIATQSEYSLPSIHGDTIGLVDGTGKLTSTSLVGPFGETLPQTNLPANALNSSSYDYLGQYQKLTETAFGLMPIQMGQRVYIPSTGRFISMDPVDGGVNNAYVYPVDPVNDNDITGTINWHRVLSITTTIASVVALVPGPIGMVASGVAVAGYAAQGNYKMAGIYAAGIALSLVGAGAATAFARASRTASAAAEEVAAAEKLEQGYTLSQHAISRMAERGITMRQVNMTLRYGESVGPKVTNTAERLWSWTWKYKRVGVAVNSKNVITTVFRTH